MVEIDTLKKAKKKPPKKKIPFAAAHTYIAYIRDYPPPPPSPGEKRVADLSLAAFASETIKQYILQF